MCIYNSMEENTVGESFTVTYDLSKWERVRQTRGPDKGQDPIVNEQGYAYVGKDKAGKKLRVYSLKEDKSDADTARN